MTNDSVHFIKLDQTSLNHGKSSIKIYCTVCSKWNFDIENFVNHLTHLRLTYVLIFLFVSFIKK